MIGGSQHDLGHDLEMRERDQRLHAKAPAHQRGEADHHGEAGIHGADHEVGREDRFLPARHQACGEVHADDAVQRDDERHAEAGERRGAGSRRRANARAEPRQPSANAPYNIAARRCLRRGRASWRDRGSGRHTRTGSRTGGSSGSPRNPRSARCATAATASSCSDRA